MVNVWKAIEIFLIKHENSGNFLRTIAHLLLKLKAYFEKLHIYIHNYITDSLHLMGAMPIVRVLVLHRN